MTASLFLLATLFVAVVPTGPASAASRTFSFTTSPAMVPSFSPAIQDYAVRCTGVPTTTLSTSGNGHVTVGGLTLNEPASVALPLVADQSVEVISGSRSYYVRCLPSDFPSYTAVISGHPKANGYLVTLGTYVIAFDNDGVPVWWIDQTGAVATPPLTEGPIDAKFLTPTTVAWNDGDNEYQVRGLDGSLLSMVGGGSIPLNIHDLQLLPNGNYLGIEYVYRDCPAVPSQCVDLSSWGQSSESDVLDNVIVEVTPAHQVVWSWSVADHIDIASENVNWHDEYPDVVHMNSIAYDGAGGVIFSSRYFDAVYRVDMATGAITWKLGGTPTPESLKWVGGNAHEPAGFSGQHFARLAPNGDLTLQDNGTRDGRPVRALEFKVDETNMTATLKAQVEDSRNAAPALCCGSALKLAGNDWVVNWGYNDYVSELRGDGSPVLTITWPGESSYRAETLDATVAALRAGMDAAVEPVLLAGDAPPDAPTQVSAVATVSGTAQIAFTPPPDNGSPITSYTVTVWDAYDPTDPSNGTSRTGGSGPIDITGLNPADTYWATVTATSAVGTSAGGSSELFAAA